MPANRILIAGLGNVFRGDDAFGVEVIRRLAERSLPDHVSLRDFGMRGVDLSYALMEDWSQVILIDAMTNQGSPGKLRVIEPEPAEKDSLRGTDLLGSHDMDPLAALQFAHMHSGKWSPVTVILCEAQTFECERGNPDLSDAVKPAVDQAIALIDEILAKPNPRELPHT